MSTQEMVPMVPGGTGNTGSTPPKKKPVIKLKIKKKDLVPESKSESGSTDSSVLEQKNKRSAPAKKWVFTWNNYTEEDIVYCNTTVYKQCKFLLFSEEVAPTTGTKHLQGYLELKTKKRLKNVAELLKKKCHVEKAKGSREDQEEYIGKDNNQNVYENGDLKLFVKILTLDEMRPWQKYAAEQLATRPDDRTIMWWYGKGGSGKTSLIRHLSYHYKCISVSGKRADMKFAVLEYKKGTGSYPRIVCFTYPKGTKASDIDYLGIEEIKDGSFFSTKYESRSVLMPPPHVAIFANRAPDLEMLTWDKWMICNLDTDPSGALKRFANEEEYIEACEGLNGPSGTGWI